MANPIKSGITSDGIVLTDDQIQVESGGTANNATLNTSGWFFVFPGGMVTHATVNSGGRMFLSGYSDRATLNSSGRIDVYSGARANETIVNYGGQLVVQKGGLASKSRISAGGYLYVLEYGLTSNAQIDSDGILKVLESGSADATTVNSGGVLMVTSGGMANNTIVNSMGKLLVSSCGTANSTTVEFGGSLFVDSGGTAAAIIENGGHVNLWNGAEVSFLKNSFSWLVLSSNQSATLHSGTTANSTTVKTGRLEIFSGGVANSTEINSSGRVEVSSGGTANDTMVSPGGIMFVSSGGTANGITVKYWGTLYVSGGGTAFSILEDGGYVNLREGAEVSFLENSISGLDMGINQSASLHSGTTANRTSIYSGFLEVFSGGTANDTTVNSDGRIYVSSGGVANDTTVNDGRFVVFNGGVANSTTVKSGGELRISSGGMANVTAVNGGWVAVCNGGAANGVTIKSGGVLAVSSGGTAWNIAWTPCEGHVYVSEGGYATFATRYSGVYIGSGSKLVSHAAVMDAKTLDFTGEMYVMSGGTANGATVNSGGELHVSSGGTANNATVNSGGHMGVFSCGTANGAAVTSGGTMYVSGDGVANRTTVDSGGCFYICLGGTANGATVNSCGDLEIFSGGMATGATVNSDGWVVVSCGGVANGVTVKNGGYLRVSSGGMALNIAWTPCEGHVDVSDGGYATFVSRYSGVYYGFDNKLISHADVMAGVTIGSTGEMFIMNGGVANGATVHSGGWIDVSSGGVANGATVDSGGELYVSNAGTARNTTVNSDGWIKVTSGGVANGATVHSGGELDLSGGAVANGIVNAGDLFAYGDATANGTTVNSGGRVFVDSRAAANGITVCDQGKLCIYGGGTATGRMTFESDAVVSMCDGSILNFDLGQTSAGGAALVNDLSIIQGTPLYTLTVDGTEAEGDYRLAMNAGGFENTITVRNTAGERLGTLTVDGGIRRVGGVNYALTVGADNVLTLAVSTVVEQVHPFETKSDIDGNGISDVMFVWTGNDYRHGFWMNGTSTWQSLDSEHPSNWDNLGCYDMTGDGKADSVLFGNVTTEGGIRGAYIGYYKDGIDLDENWVTIGYLDNVDVEWKNKVGNLTGNAQGANSIVWYAPELYTLGAWKDGKEDWVSISESFGGADWTLVGCGDFDGDGRDSIMMSYNGGQLFYTADIDGTTAEMGDANWSGWEVRAIGDFKGDGRDDLVLFHKETGSMVMIADGKTDVGNYTDLNQLSVEDWFVVGAGDYDGDAQDDLLVRQYSTGMLGYYSSGDMSRWNVLGYGVDMSWTVIA